MVPMICSSDHLDQQAPRVYRHDEQWEDAVLTLGRLGPNGSFTSLPSTICWAPILLVSPTLLHVCHDSRLRQS